MSNADHSNHGASERHLSAQVSDETFNWRPIQFRDAKVTGAQIAEAAGAHPVENFVILQQLKTFELETLRPNELADIDGASRFFVIKGDGTEKFIVDGLSLEWPRKTLSGLAIKRLVGKDDEEIELVLEREDEPDKIIDDDEDVKIGRAGVEKFHTRQAKIHLTIVVNTRDREWNKRRISFSELVAIAFPVPPTGQDIVYTITFFDGPPHHPEGTLTAGESTKVKDRMVFSVKFTDKS